jgi:hypothetical protein
MTAPIILLLVSADFIASDYCYGEELGRAMARNESGEARVIPVILYPCDWESLAFGELEALPKDGKPIANWRSRAAAFTSVTKSIREVIKGMKDKPDEVELQQILGPLRKLSLDVQLGRQRVKGRQDKLVLRGSAQDFRQMVQLLKRRTATPAVFSRLFKFNREPVMVVYTCRSRLDNTECPRQKLGDRVIEQHIPLDEFTTLLLMLDWYRDQVLDAPVQEWTERFVCSKPLDNWTRPSGLERTTVTRLNVPNFLCNNLIVIGENSVSALILSQMKAILNFYPEFSTVGGPRNPHYKTRIRDKIDLAFLDNNRSTVSMAERFRLETRFDKDGSNAVAMICYGPNPFSWQKRVLLLYGCHRVGQLLLERWLRDPHGATVLRRIAESDHVTEPAMGQVVVSGQFVDDPHKTYKFTKFHTIQNASQNIAFFPFAIPRRRLATGDFAVDRGAARQGPMVDISLVVEIRNVSARLEARLEKFFLKKLDFLKDHWLESRVRDIGLHVTLYEFATHETEESLGEGIQHFRRLAGTLEPNFAGQSPHLSLVGCEVFPQSIVLCSYLPASFLDNVRETCQISASRIDYFNTCTMPFPLHCTIVRFSERLSNEQQAELQRFAAEFRRFSFGQIGLRKLSLLLTRREPYQDVLFRKEIALPRRARKLAQAE